jgi:hypothetical protein
VESGKSFWNLSYLLLTSEGARKVIALLKDCYDCRRGHAVLTRRGLRRSGYIDRLTFPTVHHMKSHTTVQGTNPLTFERYRECWSEACARTRRGSRQVRQRYLDPDVCYCGIVLNRDDVGGVWRLRTKLHLLSKGKVGVKKN